MSDIETYRRMLSVNKHRLDDELEIMPEIMMRIAAEVTLRNSRMQEAKDDLARIEARLLEDFKDESRMSVEVARGKVLRHADRIRAWDKFQAARGDHENWSSLLDAWRTKDFAIKTLATLYAAQYFTTDSVSGSRAQRDRENDDARAALRRATHTPLAGTGAAGSERPTRRRTE